MHNLLLMGRCGRAHGVRGEVRVHPVTDDPARLETVEHLFVGASPAAARRYRVAGVRYQFPKGKVVALVALEGIAGRDAAEALTGASVYADEAELPALAEGELYVHDLVGLEVVHADDGTVLGRVADVLEAVAQDLLVVARAGAPDVLLPDVPEFIVDVDTAAGRLLARPPEGMFVV